MSLHPHLDSDGQQLCGGEERLNQGFGEFRERYYVLLGNEQHVAAEEWAVIQEGKHVVRFENTVRAALSRYDVTENTIRRHDQ